MSRQNEDITSQNEQPQNISYENLPALEDDSVAEAAAAYQFEKIGEPVPVRIFERLEVDFSGLL